MQSVTEEFMDLVLDAMGHLQGVLGEDDFELLQKLMKTVDEQFNQLVFEDTCSADEIEWMHSIAQVFSMMMELRTIEKSNMI